MAITHSARQSFYVFSGTFISRILGFVRVILIGTTLGFTRLADSYNLANEIPNMMYELILGSLIASTMVPFFVQQYKKSDSHADDALMSFVLAASLSLTAFTLVISPFLAQLMTSLNSSGSAEAQQNLVAFFLLFFLPQIFFYALTSAMQSYLAARNRFIAAAFAPIVNNVIVIGVLLYVRTRLSEFDQPLSQIRTSDVVRILATGTTAGVVAITTIVCAVYFRAGGRFAFVSFRNIHVKALISRSKWMVAYAIANQIALFIIIAIANGRSGGVAMYLVAWSFFQLPHGLIANSVMTTMVPRITHTLEVRDDNPNDISTTPDTALVTKNTATGLVALMAYTSALGIALSVPALGLLIGHGSISAGQAEETGRVLIGFLAFLPAFSLYVFIVRLANALGCTRQIFYINVVQNGLNIVLALALRDHYGIVGLSLAFSLSYFIVIFASLRVMKNHVGTSIVDLRTTLWVCCTCALAAACGYGVSTISSSLPLALAESLAVCIFILVIGGFFARESLKNLSALVYQRSETNVDAVPS